MTPLTKNILIVLALITVAYFGYYLFSQRSAMTLSTGAGDDELQTILSKTEVFIERQQALSRMNLDLTLFEDSTFRSLVSYTIPPTEKPLGKTNPFADSESTLIR
jgi:hypothetical protein